MSSKNLELALKIAATVTGDKDLTRMAEAISELGNDADNTTQKTDALANKLDALANQQGDKDLARIANAVRELGDDASSSTPKADLLANALDKLAAQQGDKNLARVADAVRELGNDADGAAPQTDELASKLTKLANQQSDKDLARIANAISELGHDASDAAPKTDTLASNLNKLGNQQSDKELTRTADAISELGNDASDAAPKTDTLAGTLDKLAKQQGDKDLSRIADVVRKLGDDAESTTPKADKLTSELAQLANKMVELSNQQRLIQELQATKRELAAQEIAAAGVASKLSELQKEVQDTSQPFVGLAQNIDKAEQQLSEMRQELNATASNQNRLQAALKQSGVDTRQLGAEKKRLQSELTQTANETKKLGNEYLASNGRQNAFSSGVASVTGRLIALAGTYLGLNKLVSTIKDIFNTGSQFERLGVQFNALMGSFAGGEQATAWVKQFAKDTPLQLEEVSRAFVRLKAFGIDPMDGTLQAVTDQAFKLGGSFQEVEGISLAVGQAWAKQKLQGEEILQLIERGVPVWDLLQQVTGKNTAELQRLSEQGKLGRDVIKDLIDEMGRSAEGAAAANMSLLSGLISNAKDNLAQFYDLIATSGAMDWLKSQLEDLNRNFEQMAADGTLKEWAQSISDTIVSIGEGIKTTAQTLYDFKGVIGGVVAVWATLKVGKFFTDLYADTMKAIAGLKRLISVKELAAIANAKYTATFVPLLAKLAAARAATTAWLASLAGGSALLAKGGIWAGIAYGVYQLGDLVVQLVKTKNANDDLKESTAGLTEQEIAWREEIARINLELGTHYKTKEDVNKALDEGLIKYDAEADAYRLATDLVNKKTQALIGHGYQLLDTSEKINELEEAYRSLGITSTQSLQDTADKAQKAYETIASSSEPLEQKRAAFLKYAEAVAKVSEVTKEAVPESLKQEAASLGLAEAFKKLTDAQTKNQQTTEATTQAQSRTQSELHKTKEAIENYRKTLNDAKASSDEKAAATAKLADAEARLTEQTRRLNQIKEIEAATFTQLQGKLAEYTEQMEALDELYKANGISAQEYIQQRERYAEVIGIIQRMLAGLSDGEEELQGETENANLSLAEQQRHLEELAESSGKATRYISLLANAQQALKTEFALADKSTEELSKRVNELNGFIVQNNRVTNIWWTELARASNAAFARERNIINETLLMRRLTEQLSSTTLTMAQLRNITSQVDRGFSQLGDNEMRVLRQAITDAENRLKSFRDKLQGTVSSLQDELDRLNNNQSAIEKRQYEQQTAELREKLKQAQASGDKAAVAAAQQALKLAEEIYRIKQKQAQLDAAANGNPTSTSRPGTTATSATSPSTRAPVPMAAPTGTVPVTTSGNTRTVRLELAMPGRTFTASIDSTEADRLLAQIERARSTSL